ncbi:MAG TPA: response regulator [Polyangiales bacterium]|nr:response regulator [Polyangiales bacterium]
MTRMLIVDDDPNQLRALARVVSVRQPGLSVVTANSAQDAIELLRSMPVDLVLTDLQMPEMNGFELVRWLMSHQPHVQVFTMTAFPDGDSVERLFELGSVECYTKPLDVGSVLERLSASLAEGTRGHVRNISMPSLLQLLGMERKTCTLTVESEGKTGYLYMSDGELVDARIGEEHGDAVAIRIVGWQGASVTIINTCVTKQRTVAQPTSFIIMEAVRLADEAKRGPVLSMPSPAARASEPSELKGFDPWESLPPPPATLSKFPPVPPSEAEALAVVELQTGRICSLSGKFNGLETLAQFVARVYLDEAATVEKLAIDERIQEIVMTAGSFWIMAQPLRTNALGIALLIFDSRRTNVMIARRELEGFVNTFDAWSASQPA